MPFEHAADPALVYDDLRRSFVDLVARLSADERSTKVPATPAWDVIDVLAHVVGIAADLNRGRFAADMDPDAWTASQVTSRRGRTVVELAAEWEAEAPQFVSGLRLFGYAFGAHFVGDLLQHVCDVRHAVGLPPPPDDVTLAVATDHYLGTLDGALQTTTLGSVVIRMGDETATAGSGEPVRTLVAPRYEVFRALGGRRSESQIRALDWHGELDTVLPLLSAYSLPEHDLQERAPS